MAVAVLMRFPLALHGTRSRASFPRIGAWRWRCGMKVGQQILLLLCLLPWAMVAFAHAPDWTARVYKLVVTHADGTTELGFAVPLGGERLVTNCHVLRGAARIEVRVEGADRQAQADQRDAYRDMCFFTLPGHRAAPMPMIDVGETRVGLEVRRWAIRPASSSSAKAGSS